MKKTFIVSTGNIDYTNDIILPTAFKDLPKEVLMTEDFNQLKPLGKAKVFAEDGLIKAQGDIPDFLLGRYPAIGFSNVSFEIRGGVRIITNLKLQYVGICAKPNVDPTIKPIGEQSMEQTLYDDR